MRLLLMLCTLAAILLTSCGLLTPSDENDDYYWDGGWAHSEGSGAGI